MNKLFVVTQTIKINCQSVNTAHNKQFSQDLLKTRFAAIINESVSWGQSYFKLELSFCPDQFSEKY